jgi:hypothetical protein
VVGLPSCRRQAAAAKLPPPSCHRQAATANLPPLPRHKLPPPATALPPLPRCHQGAAAKLPLVKEFANLVILINV